MVRLTRIYTKTGDDGTTGLVDGSRRPKCDLRLESYGTVDELNAVLGLSVVAARRDGGEISAAVGALLERLQHDLFDLGADLATPGNGEGLRITDGQVRALEAAIDEHNASLQPLESFVLPGGTELATLLHQARTVCRRAERCAVHLAAEEEIGSHVLEYLNRLSDLFFVLARAANAQGAGDVLWVPGKNRS